MRFGLTAVIRTDQQPTLDAQQRIFASNQPRELPVLNQLDETDVHYQALAGWFDAPGRTAESYTDR